MAIVYDFLFVSINRASLKKSIFSADNTHLHHKILNKFKKNHLKTVLLFSLINISIIYLGFIISNYSKLLSLIIFTFAFCIYLTIRFLNNEKLTKKTNRFIIKVFIIFFPNFDYFRSSGIKFFFNHIFSICNF